MIREAAAADESAVLAIARRFPVVGTLCEMHWRLWRQNPHMPHRFYLLGDALLKLSGRRAILCGASGDEEELLSFLHFGRVDQLMSLDWLPPGWTVLEDNRVLQRPPGPPPPAALPCGMAFDAEPHVDEVLAVLESSDGRMQPEGVRQGFWVDTVIRRNHSVAQVYGLRRQGALVATAGAYAVTDADAYIACVETLPDARNQGAAAYLLHRLLASLPRHSHTLMCQPELAPYYQGLGFAPLPHRGFVARCPDEAT